MNATDANVASPRGKWRPRRLLAVHYPSLFLLGVAALATFACYLAAGPTLGFFFGGFFVATFLIPAAALAPIKLLIALDGTAAIVLGIAMVWIIAVFQTADTAVEWLLVVITLASYGLCIAGLARALSRLNIQEYLAMAAVVLLGLAWLTWPVWLAPNLGKTQSQSVVNLLAAVHPPLTTNGILTNESAWTEHTIAYQLTNLNQDIPLRLPPTALPAVAFHLILAGGLFAISAVPRRGAPTISIANLDSK
jgi:hypothetical protein